MYDKIKELCEEKNISIYKMCSDLKISAQSITNLKNRSKTKPLAAVSLTSAVKIAGYFGISITELMRG